MTTIIPYSPPSPAARAAFTIGKAMWQNRKAIKAAAQGAYRQAKRRRKTTSSNANNRNHVGEPVAPSAPAKIQQLSVEEVIISPRSLYTTDMTNITQGTEPNQRMRNIVYLSGLRIDFSARNYKNTPTYLNIAVICPKSQQIVTDTGFFRGLGNERGINFDDGALASIDYHCRPINTDEYTVLMHKRLTLSPSLGYNAEVEPFDAYTDNKTASYFTDCYFIPVKKYLKFNRLGTTENAVTPIFFCYWSDHYQNPSSNSELPIDDTASCRVQFRCTTLFREPKP